MKKQFLLLLLLCVYGSVGAQSTQKIDLSLSRQQLSKFDDMQPIRSFYLVNDSVVVLQTAPHIDSLYFIGNVTRDSISKQLSFTQYKVADPEQFIHYKISGVSTETMKAEIKGSEESAEMTTRAYGIMYCTNHPPHSHACKIQDLQKCTAQYGCIF